MNYPKSLNKIFYVCLLVLCIGVMGAKATEPSPPVLDRNNRTVLLQPGYVEFLLEPETHRHPRITRHPSVSLGTPRARIVAYDSNERPGTIVIDTQSHALYLVQANRQARRYTVGVGREGYGWHGVEHVSKKRQWPAWQPPAEMRARRSNLPPYMAGGPDNPLGARALYLGNTLYRIHGSNEPETIGLSVSSGCFRMTNEDVIDLYNRVDVGAKVVVL